MSPALFAFVLLARFGGTLGHLVLANGLIADLSGECTWVLHALLMRKLTL